MDLFIWFWGITPFWIQQIFGVLGILIVFCILLMFLNNSFRTAEASEDRRYQSNVTNDLLRQILDILDPDEEEDDDDDEDEEVNDLGELERRVAKAFSTDPILALVSEDLDIEAMDGGVIELAGEVRSHEEFERAVMIAEKVDGVKEVLALLQIVPTSNQIKETGDLTSKDSGILPVFEDMGHPDIRTESALMHSIPGPVSKTRE